MVKKIVKKDMCYVDYQEELIKSLKDRDHAIAYLNAALEESLKGDDESVQLFINALNNVLQAQASTGKRNSVKKKVVAKELSHGAQAFATLMHAMGFNIHLS